MNPIKQISKKIHLWYQMKKYNLAVRWTKQLGLSVVKIIEVSGTMYIMQQDGIMRRLRK